jgi:hypothetical protein
MGRRDLEGWWDDAAHALEVAASEFIVATAGAADIQEYAPLCALLQRMRRAFGIDAAFVSDRHAEPGTDALQSLYGRRLLEADVAAPARFRFEAVPVVTRAGHWRGTLCCRSADPLQEDTLQSLARLVAGCFEQAPVAA